MRRTFRVRSISRQVAPLVAVSIITIGILLVVTEPDGRIDLSRVHFLGRIAYARYLEVLRRSSVHVYLTYPFVLSWSLLEAMAAGCLVVGSRTPPVEEVIRVRTGEMGHDAL